MPNEQKNKNKIKIVNALDYIVAIIIAMIIRIYKHTCTRTHTKKKVQLWFSLIYHNNQLKLFPKCFSFFIIIANDYAASFMWFTLE